MAKAKEIIGLDCSAGALDGAALVLAARFEEIIDLHGASGDFSDIEIIHDLRVGMRRLRSALRDFMPLFNKDSFKPLKKDLKGISDALGRVRDEDVAIEALDRLQAEADEATIKAQIGVFAQERRDSRESAGSELTELLTAEKLRGLKNTLSEKLDEARNSNDETRHLSFRELGKIVIEKNLREFEELSPALYNPFDVFQLHRLRIAAKRLRYAMKVFAVCWADETDHFAKKVSKMQSHLGDTHDCDEWIEKLLTLLREESDELEKDKRDALIWLMSIFFERRNKEYAAALKLWSDWQTDYFLARLRALTL